MSRSIKQKVVPQEDVHIQEFLDPISSAANRYDRATALLLIEASYICA